MDLTDSSADWISQFEYSGHGSWEDEIPSFHSSMFLQESHGDCGERAAKIPKTNSSSSSTSSAHLRHFSGGSGVISFGSNSPPFDQTPVHQFDVKPPKLESAVSGNVMDLVEAALADGSGPGRWRRGDGAGGGGTIGMKEHVIAERKRREKLSQRFISLSSLLPGLKKMDKASVLGEAARYVKQLQEQVKTLEEDQKASRSLVESVIVARSPKNNSSIEDGNWSSSSSSNDNVESSSSGDHLLPEIEARFSNKDVLIKVHCTRNQGIVPKVLDEIQKLHLGIVNCNSMPFGRSSMVITVVAEMNDEFSATSKELVNMIRQSLQTLT